MRFEGITPRGETIDLGEPVSVRLDRAADAPADAMNLSFLGSRFICSRVKRDGRQHLF